MRGFPYLTSNAGNHIVALVIRLFIGVLATVALALSPAAVANARAAPSAMPACTMGGHVPVAPADHAKMECCTPACQLSPAAAFLHDRHAAAEPVQSAGARHASVAVEKLPSFTSSGLDPPPRLLS